MKALLLLSVTSLGLAGALMGNPVVRPDPNHLFIAEENLRVMLKPDHAVVQCDVTIREAAGDKKGPLSPYAQIWLPVWFPADYEGENFKRWDKLGMTGNRSDSQRADAEIRNLCDIKVRINGTEEKQIGAIPFEEKSKSTAFPPEAFPKGFRCVAFLFNVDVKACKAGGKLSLSWKQPHASGSKGAKRFFYLPILPISETTVEAPHGKYARSASLRCEQGVRASLGWQKESIVIHEGGTATLTLSHLSPLMLTVSPMN